MGFLSHAFQPFFHEQIESMDFVNTLFIVCCHGQAYEEGIYAGVR